MVRNRCPETGTRPGHPKPEQTRVAAIAVRGAEIQNAGSVCDAWAQMASWCARAMQVWAPKDFGIGKSDQHNAKTLGCACRPVAWLMRINRVKTHKTPAPTWVLVMPAASPCSHLLPLRDNSDSTQPLATHPAAHRPREHAWMGRAASTAFTLPKEDIHSLTLSGTEYCRSIMAVSYDNE